MDEAALALPPKQLRSRKSIEQAIDGAIEVIRESGWEGFTMAAVSRHAGVSVPLLHRRFGGKEELFLAAQATVSAQIEADVLSVFYSSSQWEGLGARATIERAVEGLAEISARYGRTLRGVHERGLDDTRVRDRAGHTVALKHRLVRELLLSFRGDIALDDPDVGVDVFYVCTSATLQREQMFNDTEPQAWDRLTAELAAAGTAYLLDGSQPLPDVVMPDEPVAPAASAEDPRERLLRSALELLAERDYRGVTAAAVSDNVKMTVSALYSVFENKDELMAEVERVALEQLLADARRRLGALDAAAPARERVAAAVTEVVRLISANRAGIRVLLHRRAGAELPPVLDEIRDLFRAAIAPGDFVRHPDPDFATAVCFKVAFSVMTGYLPRDRYLTSRLGEGRLYAEVARFCSAYLNSESLAK